MSSGKKASGVAPFADDDIDIGVDFPEEDLFWQNETSNPSAAPTAPSGEATPAPTMVAAIPVKKSPPKVVIVKKPKAQAKKNLRSFPCVVEGCKFAAKYAKDLERHARTHTGKFHTVL